MVLSRALSNFDKKKIGRQFEHFNLESFYGVFLLESFCAFLMFSNIPDKSNRLKREASWFGIFFLEGILFGPTISWLVRKSLFFGGRKSKTCFFLISTRGLYIVSALVEKYLLKALPIVIGQLNYAPNGLVSKLFWKQVATGQKQKIYFLEIFGSKGSVRISSWTSII